MNETRHTVLLIDRPAPPSEAVRQRLQDQGDIAFHFCGDPTKALQMASEVHPTVILLSLDLPHVDGLNPLALFRSNPTTRDIPLLVLADNEDAGLKAEAFESGANDFLLKVPPKAELAARVRYHSDSYIRLLERNEAYARLDNELDEGAKYLELLLPPPIDRPVAIDRRYVPWTRLGGDTFGYDWIDTDHLSLFILDVSGHGVAAALLSVSIMHVLRSRSLRNIDFRVPGQVLAALNAAFPFALGEKFFTIWYGVFRHSDATLFWASGGHPDLLLFEPSGGDSPARLGVTGPLMGVMDSPEFITNSRPVPLGSRMYLFTDGVHEIHMPDGGIWTFDEFVEFMSVPAQSSESLLDRLLAHVRRLHGSDLLDDDFSIVEVRF